MQSSSEEEEVLSDSSDEDFNFIRPTLTKQLRNILQKYPDNGQIIKEILQNAEDARATTVKLLYDETCHQTIFDLGKDELRKPSLYVYNDGMFTKKDWKGIRMLEDSFKEKDPLKIGRFGLGFKSIFHLTDYPSIISGTRYGINSPDEGLFGKGKDGELRDFHKRPPEKNAHRDQSDIYHTILNTDVRRGKCQGTLFRLPLRQNPSPVSSTIYDSKRVSNLFDMFFQEGKMSLVFLQHLEKIEFYIRKRGNDRAEILRSFSISDDRLETLREARRNFTRDIEESQSDSMPDTITQTVQMDIVEKVSRYKEGMSSFYVSNVYACEELREEEAGITTEAAKEEGVAPLVGVAFQIDGVSDHVFCALPLPTRNESLTGLPVHVNGSFALGPERNDLKRASAADGKVDDKKILWNEFLKNHALPVAYVNLLGYILSFAKTKELAKSLYNALPCLEDVNCYWSPLAAITYQKVFAMKFLWTEANRGCFTDIQSAIFMKPDEERKGMLIVRDVLIKKGKKIVQAPNHVYNALEKFGETEWSTKFDLAYVRKYLKSNPSTVTTWSKDGRLTVLKSVLETAKDLIELNGVEILPTLNGSFCKVDCKQMYTRDHIYVPSQEHPSSLIPDMKHHVVSWGENERLYKLFFKAAEKKLCQLRLLDSSTMVRLVKEMQSSWAKTSGLAFLLKQHPSVQTTWLVQFWEYITKHNVSISDVEGMLLIPLNYSRNAKTVDLVRLEKQSTLLYVDNTYVVTTELQQVLTGLGCTLIPILPDCIIHKWGIFGTYIYRCTPEDLLQIFVNMYKKTPRQICKEVERRCNAEMKGKLVEIFSKALQNQEPDDTEREMLQSLPLFKVFHRNHHVSVSTTSFIAPKNLRMIPEKQMLANSDQKKLAQKLGAIVISDTDLVAHFLIPELSRKVDNGINCDQLIDVILEYVQRLLQEDGMGNSRARVEGILSRLSEMNFLPGRKKANVLFDPTDQVALKIFKSLSHFPPPGYKKYIDILRRLGLRSAKDIREQEILDVISQIEEADIPGKKEQGREQSAALLQLFNEHPHLLPSSRSSLSHIQQRKWIEVLQERPFFYPPSLPWYPEESRDVFESPNCIFHESNAILVGALHHVTKQSVNILQNGRMKEPDIHDVKKQLGIAISSYNNTEKHAFVNVLDRIYRFMTGYYGSVLSSVLSSLPNWAWNGSDFVKPSQIVINPGKDCIDLKPYVFAIPDEMFRFKQMFLKQGAFAEDNNMCLISVLRMIKEKHEREANGINPSHDRRDVKLIKEILQELYQRELDEDDIEALLLPTRSYESNFIELTPRKNCVYAKQFGLNIDPNEYLDSGSSTEAKLTHPIVSQEMADKFELKKFHSHVLDAEELMFEEYGQYEPLTTRLNRLLEDYRDGFAIPKELLQNADDAGAKEIKFLYDGRQNEDAQNSLLTPEMRGFQGPALWVYNDAIFTDEDFTNLTKLHGATKKEKADKIGKFGLGFNSVYNLTDLPSLVSNESMVLLDPHANHLGEHIRNPSQPGIKLKLKNKKAVQLYQDQWKPYDGVFNLSFNPSNSTDCFAGTLFRFPLRTKNQASNSEIKGLAYDNREMKKFICKLLEGAGRLLLFTQNVSRLSVYHLADNSNPATDMIEIFSMEKAITVLRPLSSGESGLNILTKAAEMVKVGKRPATEQLCVVAIGVERRLSQSARLFVNDFKSFEDKDTWLITSHIDSGDCFDFAVKSAGLNPSVSVAMRLLSENNKLRAMPLECDADKGHVFCHVPLPITTDFPVHLNGSFAVTANRQALQEISEDDKDSTMEGPTWNRLLMHGPVAKAYLSTLEYVLKTWNGSAAKWFALWPCQTTENDKSCLSTMTRGFYSKLIERQVRLLPIDEKQWCNWDEMVLFEEGLLEDENVKDSIITVCKILMPKRKFVDMPKKVKDSISNVGFRKYVEKKSITKQQFFQLFMKNIENSRLPAMARDTITKYALLHCDDDDLLRNSKCIPTMPCGALKSPTCLIDYASETKDLFFTTEEVFPTSEFQEDHLRSRLLQLGMVSEDIPMRIFKERAATVKTLAKRSHKDAKTRSQVLVTLLNKKMRMSPGKAPASELQTIPFLPVRKVPTDWHPLPWKGENVKRFLPPSELFFMKHSLLIGCHSAVVDESDETGCGPLGQELSDALQVKDNATFNDIIVQVKQLSRVDGKLPQQAKQIFSEMYKWLQKHLKNMPEEITHFLKSTPSILIDSRVIKPASVSFELSFDARPYLYQLPEEYAINFGALMKKIGVEREFHREDYLSALHAMKEKFKESRLSKEDVKLCRSLLERINENLSELTKETQNEESPLDGKIYMPDTNGILRNASEVCINSHPWIPRQDDTKYVHPDIPNALAWSLGAKESRSDHFQKHSIGLPFGQHESLTVRLRKILDSYCVEDQIMNEMLQNADDAQASEVHFILDPRKHGGDKIFCDEWEPLQGPALLIRNNGVFRPEDLTGIQRLGEGSKTEDVFTAGKYGVGFNVVYHLTDAPSLLTSIDGEDVLCLFDPHAKYFEGATRETPGRKIVNAVENLKETYTDIHSSFLLDTLKDGPATLFRLPLRNAEMAKSSEISHKEMSVIKVKEMLQRFQRKLMSSVIFLNHIEKVKISEIDEKTGAINEIYSVTVKCDAASKHQKRLLSKDLETVSKSMRENEGSLEDFPCKPYTLQISDSTKLCEKWQVIQKIGSTKNIPKSVRDHGFDKISCLPVGGIACCESSSKSSKGFSKIDNVSYHGKYFCLLPLTFKTDLPVNINGQFILEHESRHRLWSTKNEGFQRDWNKYLLEDCIAPCYADYIKMRAGTIKIHFKRGAINEVVAKTYPGGDVTDPNRKPNQERDNVNKGSINPSNQHLKSKDHTNNKPPDEMSPRDNTKCLYPGELHSYFKVFPTWSEKDEEYNSTLKRRLYQELSDSEALVLPVLRPRHSEIAEKVKPEWFAPTSSTAAKFFVPDFTIKDATGKSTQGGVYAFGIKKIRSILDLLLKEGMNIFNVPKYIQEAFERAEKPLAKLTPQSTREYLQMKRKLDSVSNKNLKPEKITMICNVLEFCEIQSLKELDGLPLLVTGENMLGIFDSHGPIFIDTISEIFTSKKGVCLHWEIKSILGKAIDSYQANNAEAEEEVPLKRFKIKDLVAALNEDDACKALKVAEYVYEIPYSENTLPSKDWLWRLWSYLRNECAWLCYQNEKEQQELELEKDGGHQCKKIDLDAERIKAEERRKELTRQLLDPLSDWCLLPAERRLKGNDPETVRWPLQKVLVPMKYCKSLCNRHHEMSEFLDEMGILTINCTLLRRYLPPELRLSYIKDPNEKFVREIVASVSDPRAFLYALYMQSLKDGGCFEKIYSFQRDKLLQQLSGKDINWDDEMLRQIRSLKIFNAVNEMPYSIGDKTIIIPPDEVPFQGSEIWMREAEVVACKKNASLERLYNTLWFIQADDLQLYEEHIFPCFAKMTEEDRHKHLVYIRTRDSHKSHDCVKKEENKKPEPCPLFGMLAEIPFLFVDGTLSRAKDLFDHSNTVFPLFLPESCFPPKKYRESDWMPFLKKLGLVTTVSSDKYLEFARQVERSSIPEKSLEKSKTLVSYLFSTKELKEDACFMRSVAQVNYLFADGIREDLNSVVPAFVERRSKVCFRDSFCVSYHRDVAMIWTVAAILPGYVHSELDLFLYSTKANYLGIQFRISTELVERNFIYVIQSEKLTKRLHRKIADNTVLINEDEDKQKKKVTLKDTIFEIFEATYEFLSRAKNSTQYLQDYESVLIRGTGNDHHTLVKPCDATLANNVNLRPYLWTVDTYFGKYFNWFKSIGVTEKPSSIQVAAVLEKIANKLQGKCMDQQAATMAHRAVGHLRVALSDQGNIQDVQTLYLPSARLSNANLHYLRKSHEMIYIDDMSRFARLKKFEEPCLVYNSEAASAEEEERDMRIIVKKLPEGLRPKRLSDLISEEMIPAQMIGNGEVAESLLTTIQSKEFRNSLWRLHINEGKPHDDENSMNVLDDVLTRIEIRTLDKIETILKYEDEEIPESQEEKPCFIVKEDDLLVVNITLLPGEEKLLLCTTIARELVNKLHAVITTTGSATLIPFLLNMSPKEMMKSLDALGIRRDKTMENESEEAFGSHTPKPGDFVPTELHWMLNNSFEEYDVGEFVAYEIEDPESLASVFIYANVRRKIQEHEDSNDSIHNYRYEICIGEGEMLEVKSFQIYKFSRNETGALDTVVDSGNASSAIDPLIGITYEGAKTEIMKCLQEAKSLESDKRRLFIKRLYRKWHPDKHEDRPEFFNKVFQFLMSQIKRMENNEDLFDEEDGGHPSARNNWNDFFNTWDREARQNNHFRQQYRSRPGGGSFWRGCPQWRANSNPQPYEAKRWYRQAKFDFDAARTYRTNEYFEWQCFKCHQAAEKALKAALFAINADKSMDHNLRILASDLEIDGIQRLASMLEQLLGGSSKLRYPDRWRFPQIPHDQYTRDMADQAVTITSEIIDKVGQFLNQNQV